MDSGLEFTKCFHTPGKDRLGGSLHSSLRLQALEVKGRFKENFKKGGFESHVFSVI